MELDITGKVGIENALEQLKEELYWSQTPNPTRELTDKEKLVQDTLGRAYEKAIEIVTLNLPVKNK